MNDEQIYEALAPIADEEIMARNKASIIAAGRALLSASKPAATELAALPWLDRSTADPVEKARRVLGHLIEPNLVYYFEDGFPRPELKQQAANCLAVLNALAASPAAPAQSGDAVLPAWFDTFLTNVCEIPDRNSPEDEPETIVATLEELKSCALNAIENMEPSTGIRLFCGEPINGLHETGCPQAAPSAVVLDDERAAFEAWMQRKWGYVDADTVGYKTALEAWLARAAWPNAEITNEQILDIFYADASIDACAATTVIAFARRLLLARAASPQPVAQPVEQTADSARLRFLADDIADADVRRARNELLERMPVMSYSAVCMQIDAILIEHGLALNVAPQNNATSISDAMMDLVDRLGHEWKDVDPRAWSRLLVYAPQPVEQTLALTDAARDVLAERLRQMSVEGWTPEHDDSHSNNELSLVAACYAVHDAAPYTGLGIDVRRTWPFAWDWSWWKPKDRRRNLVKAGALILAEIERLDRAAARPASGETE